MSRRWYPRGGGFIRVIDCGDLAVWMRPEPAGGVTIAMYAAGYFYDDGSAEVWLVRVPRGSWLPDEVMDKPHRLRWCLKPDSLPEFAAEAVARSIIWPSHRGHRRLNWNRQIWRWPLPRPIRNALEPGGRR